MMRLTVTARDGDFVAVRFTGGKTAQAVALIEAAPDLLAALQALVGEADLGEIDHDDGTRALLAQARAAIARATGGQ